MPHANAPLTPTGRLCMVERHLHDDIRIAHVAAEFRVSRPTITIWVARYRTEGHPGLQDRPSRPHTATSQLDPYFIVLIEGLRRVGSGQPGAFITTCAPRVISCTCAP